MSDLQHNTGKPDAGFWKKKAAAGFLMSVLIFFIHLSTFYNYTDTGNAMSTINNILALTFKEGFTRFVVPLYFIIAGALFFRDYSQEKYIPKLRKRVKTLLIPYLMWNIIWMIFCIVTSYTFLSRFFVGREKFEITPLNVLLSLIHHECNGHFWFVFDLIVFVVFSPVIDFLIQTRKRAICSVAVLALLSVMGYGIPASIFYTNTSIVYYLIGAAIGRYGFAYFLRPSALRVRIVSAAVLLGFGVFNVVFYEAFSGSVKWTIQYAQFLFCGWAFWNVCDWIPDDSIIHSFSDCSFAVYAMHGNVGACITKLLYLVLPKSEYLAPVNFVLSVVLTLLFIKGFCLFTRRFTPRLHEMLMGSR